MRELVWRPGTRGNARWIHRDHVLAFLKAGWFASDETCPEECGCSAAVTWPNYPYLTVSVGIAAAIDIVSRDTDLSRLPAFLDPKRFSIVERHEHAEPQLVRHIRRSK